MNVKNASISVAMAISALGCLGIHVPIYITNDTVIVPNDVTSYSVGGTNTDEIIGDMWVSNASDLAGCVALPFPAELSWTSPPINLVVGDNGITVSGTDAFDNVWNDSVIITRDNLGTGSPFVDITNETVSVSYDVTRVTIGGTNNAQLAGRMWWSNSLNDASGGLWSDPSWTISDIALEVGSNVIAVTGTNLVATRASDSIVIVRMPFGTGAPFVDVTNEPVVLSYDAMSYWVSGTNNDQVVGDMWVTNETAGGEAQSFPAFVGWAAPAIPLEVGANTIAVYGTNALGDVAGDSVLITRGDIGTGAPFIEITDPLDTLSVKCTVASCTISGTNNPHVVGMMSWTNAATLEGNTFAALSTWSIPGILLATGDNEITVYGTNALGDQTLDTATVYRKTLAESLPRIATNALIFPSADSVLNATLATDIVWWVDGIMDDANDTNLTIAQMGVLVRDDSSEVAVASADISNVLGQISWTVPSSLIGGGTTYVLRFDVVDSDSLTGSVVFVDNPFTVVPEPTSLGVLAVVAILGFRKSNARPA